VHICEHVAVGVEGCVDAGVAQYLLHDFSALPVPKTSIAKCGANLGNGK
jgi:hypothetical protein